MKTPIHNLTLLGVLFSFGLFAQGPWTQKSSLPANGRHRCVTFSVGQRGYMGCGWNGVTMYNDFWEYDPGSDTWMQKQNYPGGARLSAFGFSIGSKGYAGCGLDQALYGQPDFYEYNPATNQWTAKAMWPSVPIFGASAAVINNKGYVVCGDDWDPNYWRHNEMYSYDPSTNSWSFVTTLPADGRRDPVGFAINNKFYVGTGNDNSYMEDSDWWEFNPSNGVWTQKAMFIGSARSQAVAWAVNGKGYVGTGGQLDETDFFEYDPVTNSWQGINAFPGQGRENAQSFVIGNKGYLVCGTSGVNYADIWEFDPLELTSVTTSTSSTSAIHVFPNPIIDRASIEIDDAITEEKNIQVYNSIGQEVFTSVFSGNKYELMRNELPAGTYVLRISSGKRVMSTRVIFR